MKSTLQKFHMRTLLLIAPIKTVLEQKLDKYFVVSSLKQLSVEEYNAARCKPLLSAELVFANLSPSVAVRTYWLLP